MGEGRILFYKGFNPNNAGLLLTVDGEDSWYQTKKEGREDKIKKIQSLNLKEGDKLEVTGSGPFYNEVKVISRVDGDTTPEAERVKEPKEDNTNGYVAQNSYEKNKQHEKDHYCRLNAMNNAVLIINALIESKSIKVDNIDEYHEQRNIIRKDIFKELTEDWRQ